MQIDTKRIDSLIENALYYSDLPGLAVGIGNSSSDLYKKVLGYMNYEDKTPLLLSDKFHMASVTKLFVGIAILQLVRKGLISLDKPLTYYLDWFKLKNSDYQKIKIINLLSHTSGISDCTKYNWESPSFSDDALEKYLKSDIVLDSLLLSSPDDNEFHYSDINYEILGHLIALLTGISFEEYMTKNILSPLGMDDTTLLFLDNNIGQAAMPHERDVDKHIKLLKFYPNNREHGPSSGLTSNLDDILKFGRCILKILASDDHDFSKIVNKKELLSAMEKRTIVPNNGELMGISWFQRRQCGHTLFGHEGNDPGFRSSFWLCPEKDVCICVNSNITDAPVKKISKQIFEILK